MYSKPKLIRIVRIWCCRCSGRIRAAVCIIEYTNTSTCNMCWLTNRMCHTFNEYGIQFDGWVTESETRVFITQTVFIENNRFYKFFCWCETHEKQIRRQLEYIQFMTLKSNRYEIVYKVSLKKINRFIKCHGINYNQKIYWNCEHECAMGSIRVL